MAAPRHAHGAPRRTGRVVALSIALALCLIGAGAGIAYLALSSSATRYEVDKFDATEQPSTPDVLASEASAPLPSNPIDFQTLQAQNPDLFAWLYIPDTKVNRAVLQRSDNDEYYLTHDEMGAVSAAGSLFTEHYNTTTLEDPVTVIYGHNWTDDMVFASLHQFQDQAFFDACPYFYLYAPGHVYTYEVVSAFTADNRHLLATHDYTDPAELLAFQAQIAQPDALQSNVRDVPMDESSHIVVLSTCLSNAWGENGRYLVCGVMVDDMPTA